MNKVTFGNTFRLFKPRNYFVTGMDSLVDPLIQNEIYNLSESDDAADADSISSDFKQVGEDINFGIISYGRK